MTGFAFGLYAGAMADRVDRRTLILRMNLLRALLLAVLTATIALQVVNVLIVLSSLLLLGTVDTFVNPTSIYARAPCSQYLSPDTETT